MFKFKIKYVDVFLIIYEQYISNLSQTYTIIHQKGVYIAIFALEAFISEKKCVMSLKRQMH